MESIITAIIKALASIFPAIYLERFKKYANRKCLEDSEGELDLLNAYITLIKPDTPMSITHADIISSNFKAFERDFQSLLKRKTGDQSLK